MKGKKVLFIGLGIAAIVGVIVLIRRKKKQSEIEETGEENTPDLKSGTVTTTSTSQGGSTSSANVVNIPVIVGLKTGINYVWVKFKDQLPGNQNSQKYGLKVQQDVVLNGGPYKNAKGKITQIYAHPQIGEIIYTTVIYDPSKYLGEATLTVYK